MQQKLNFTLESTPCIAQKHSLPERRWGEKAAFTHVEPCHSELVSESATGEMLKQCKANKRGTSFVSLYASAKPLAVQHDMLFKRVAFTLAEVLITLAIIGVVAAITIPGLVTKINDKVKNTRITTIEKKLHQGTDKLMLMGHINGYDTTEEFVKALSEHMKISTYCSADRIADCFPYDKINVEGENGTVEVSDLNTPEAFGLDSEKYSNPVSFITGDGTPYIIMYQKDCKIDDGDGRANSTECIAGIYDWNGSRIPNRFAVKTKEGSSNEKIATDDILFLGGVTKLAKYEVFHGDGYLNVTTPNGYTYFKVLPGYYKYSDAVTACEESEMELPPIEDLMSVFCEILGPNGGWVSSYQNKSLDCKSYTRNTVLTKSINDNHVYVDSGLRSITYSSCNYVITGQSSGGLVSCSEGMWYNVICLGK